MKLKNDRIRPSLSSLLDIYIKAVNNKYFKVIIKIIFYLYLFTIFIIYSFNYGYTTILIAINWFFIIILLILAFSIDFHTQLNSEFFQNIIRSIIGEKKRFISFKTMFLCFPLLLVLMANIFLLLFIIKEDIKIISLASLINIEVNIFYKIFSIFIFYSFFSTITYALGRKILNYFKLFFEKKLLLFLFSIGIGLIPIMLGFFLLGLFGLYHTWVAWLFTISVIFFTRKEITLIFNELKNLKLELYFNSWLSSTKIITFVLLATLFSCYFILITKPIPYTSDDLHTYFNAPYLYTQYHDFRQLNHANTSNLGQNTEMIYVLIMLLVGTKFIIHLPLFFFILTIIGLYCLAKKLFGERFALLSVIFTTCIPWNLFFAYSVKVEFILAFYSVLILIAFALWRDKNKLDIIYLIGVLSGITMGIKYNAAFLLLPIFVSISFSLFKKHKFNFVSSIKPLIIFSTIALLFFMPWGIKNYIYFNNPFYPYIFPDSISNDVFNTKEYVEYSQTRSREVGLVRHSLQYNKYSFPNIISTAWNKSTGKNIQQFEMVNFGVLPILLLPFFVLMLRDKKIIIYIFLGTFYFLLWYILNGSRAWYAFSGIIFLYSLIPYFLQEKKICTVVLTINFFIVGLLNIFIVPENIKYLIGQISPSDYKNGAIFYSDVATRINELNLKSEEKILLVGDFQTAFINRNDEIIIIDPYLAKIGSILIQGEVEAKKELQNKSIRYIIYSEKAESYKNWLTNNNQTITEYLQKYKEKHPSIYNDIQKTKKFLDQNATIELAGEYYKLYKL